MKVTKNKQTNILKKEPKTQTNLKIKQNKAKQNKAKNKNKKQKNQNKTKQ